LEAAEALVADYLNGRTLPEAVHKAAVQAARTRLIEGKEPILDETLRSDIDREASRPLLLLPACGVQPHRQTVTEGTITRARNFSMFGMPNIEGERKARSERTSDQSTRLQPRPEARWCRRERLTRGA
jgi:hypothetical protein